jgi:hypothetical protein
MSSMPAPEEPAQKKASFAAANDDAPEFEVSGGSPEWNPDGDSQPGKKK